MRRLTEAELQERVALVRKYMELEGSYYSLEDGIVKIPKLIGEAGYRKESFTKDGYPYYILRDRNRKKGFSLYMHHIVMILADGEAYIEQMSKGMTINHKDGNKGNNSISNLEYLSHADNLTHAQETGLIKEKPLEELISEHEVYKILKAYHKEGKSIEELSKAFELTVSAINKIVKGKLHRHVYTMYKAYNADSIRVAKKGRCKLTKEQVNRILRMYHIDSVSQGVIASKYGVSRSAVAMIASGQRWEEVYKAFQKQRVQIA